MMDLSRDEQEVVLRVLQYFPKVCAPDNVCWEDLCASLHMTQEGILESIRIIRQQLIQEKVNQWTREA